MPKLEKILVNVEKTRLCKKVVYVLKISEVVGADLESLLSECQKRENNFKDTAKISTKYIWYVMAKKDPFPAHIILPPPPPGGGPPSWTYYKVIPFKKEQLMIHYSTVQMIKYK